MQFDYAYDQTYTKIFIYASPYGIQFNNIGTYRALTFDSPLFEGDWAAAFVNNGVTTMTNCHINDPTVIVSNVKINPADTAYFSGTFPIVGLSFTSMVALPTGDLQIGDNSKTMLITVTTNVNAGQLLYLSNSGTYLNASATSITTMLPVGMATQTVTAGSLVRMLVYGTIKMTSWSWATVGSGTPLYVSTTGVLTSTAPTATGNIDFPCAYPVSSNTVFFSAYPYSNSWVTHA
jgi:hypothetical protein